MRGKDGGAGVWRERNMVGEGKDVVPAAAFGQRMGGPVLRPTAPCEVCNILAWDLTRPNTFSVVQTEHHMLNSL